MDVRPIGMGRRAWTSRLFEDDTDMFRRACWPLQVALGVHAAMPKLFMTLAEHMHAHPTHVLLKLDFTNAFNTVWCAATLRACLDKPEWRHLYRFLWTTLPHAVQAFIKGSGVTYDEGAQQGDVAGPHIFRMPVKKHAEWALSELKKVDGMTRFDMDDGYFVGPIEEVMRVIVEFKYWMAQFVGANLNPPQVQAIVSLEHPG